MIKWENNQHLFFISLLFHIIILAILVINLEFSSPSFVLENSDQNNVINAVVLNPSKIQMPEPTPFSPPKPPEQAKKILAPAPAPKPIAKPVSQMKKLPTPVVQKNVIALSDHRKKPVPKDLIQKQLLDDLKQAEQQKKKKHKELEQAFAAEMKAQAAQALQQQLLSEQNRASSAQAQKSRGIVNKYKALILETISQHWLVPPGVDKSLSTELLIRVAPGGVVLDVQIVKSSGEDALDRSARTAILKASPLPVPTDLKEFEPFRQFVLKVKPENVLARDNGLE